MQNEIFPVAIPKLSKIMLRITISDISFAHVADRVNGEARTNLNEHLY